MISSLRTMLTCHWSARRLQRYLDADPAGALPPQEVRRLQAHLAVCRRCREVVEESRLLALALGRWSARRAPDPAAVARLRRAVDDLVQEDTR